MPSIQERDGSFRVQVRIKGKSQISKTFAKREDAELWGAWKENLLKTVRDFEVPDQELLTLRNIIDQKVKAANEAQLTTKSLGDLMYLYKEFEEWLELPLQEITFDMAIEKADQMLGQYVSRGGDVKRGFSGRQQMQSPLTVFRKFNYLGSCFGHARDMGVTVPTDFQRALSFLREKLLKKKDPSDQESAP